GAVTVSHLRFGDKPIRSTYLITSANFIACHQPQFLERFDMVKDLAEGGTFLVNAPTSVEFPPRFLAALAAKNARLFVIDATKVGRENGRGNRINTIMQVCFFATANVMPIEDALASIRGAIKKTYAKKGEKIVAANMRAVDAAIENLKEVVLSPESCVLREDGDAGHRTQDAGLVIDQIIANRGDHLPVSALPCDGTFFTGTTRFEKRNLAVDLPVWDTSGCIQC